MNANKLRGAMAEKGITQAQLAEAIEISSNSMSRKLSGKRVFSLPEVEKICKVLDISDPVSIFFSDTIPHMQHPEEEKR